MHLERAVWWKSFFVLGVLIKVHNNYAICLLAAWCHRGQTPGFIPRAGQFRGSPCSCWVLGVGMPSKPIRIRERRLQFIALPWDEHLFVPSWWSCPGSWVLCLVVLAVREHAAPRPMYCRKELRRRAGSWAGSRGLTISGFPRLALPQCWLAPGTIQRLNCIEP